MGAVLLLAALLAQAPSPPAGEQRSPAPRQEVEAVHQPDEARPKPPLSDEDRELVKELALLEELELVKNLELFEADKDEKPQQAEQRQP